MIVGSGQWLNPSLFAAFSSIISNRIRLTTTQSTLLAFSADGTDEHQHQQHDDDVTTSWCHYDVTPGTRYDDADNTTSSVKRRLNVHFTRTRLHVWTFRCAHARCMVARSIAEWKRQTMQPISDRPRCSAVTAVAKLLVQERFTSTIVDQSNAIRYRLAQTRRRIWS